MRVLKRIFKIISWIFLSVFVGLIVLFYWFSKPKADKQIQKAFAKSGDSVFISHIKYKQFQFRVLAPQKEIDSTLTTIVFVHGSIGSAFDFKKYLTDVDLKKKANLIAYDRIGYGIFQTGNVQASIAFETDMLSFLIDYLKLKKVILVGYSYGGPIALAYLKPTEHIVLLAPAVYAEVEPMPWAIHFYKWKITRLLLPKIWQAASKEKMTHKVDLEKFEQNWTANKSKILCIQGNSDWIVPYENSLYLQRKFPTSQFKLITLKGVGHGLVWTHFVKIKKELINLIDE